MKKGVKKFLKVLTALALLGACAVIVYGVVTGYNLLENINGWWTLFLIIPGICGLFQRGSRLFSFGLILFGGIMLLSENANSWLAAYPDVAQRVSGINWILAAGVVVLFLAALAILGSVFGIKKKKYPNVNVSANGDITFSASNKAPSKKKTSGNEYSAVFSERDVSFAGQSFTGGEFSAIFSSYTADLTNAVIDNSCTIDANAVFGTVVIKTGLNANYKVNGSQIMGSVSCVDRPENPELPTVTINANSVFGSIEII